MSADLLRKEDIVFGNKLEVIALCSRVEVKQNFSTTGSYREIYYLHGYDGAFISGIIFKLHSAPMVEEEVFTDVPVLVKGTVGNYREVDQIHIESISPLTDVLDRDDLLAEMVDTSIIDSVNDILYDHQSMYNLTFKHLQPALGLEEATAGSFALRLYKLLKIGVWHYPEETKEYIKSIALLAEYFLGTECTLNDRFELLHAADKDLMKALFFSTKDYPEYEEFVKLHHLIMKPRGVAIEIVDNIFTSNNNNSGIRGEH